MKIISLICLVFLSLSFFRQTQPDSNTSTCETYQKTYQEMNQVYQRILHDYREDTAFIRNIKAAQLQWIKLRDADIRAIFTSEAISGPEISKCQCSISETMTKDRIKFLKYWSEGLPKGSLCRGSRKIRE